MKFIAKLEKQKETWFLIIVSFLFFLLRIPSLFEPLWYGDEGIYEVIGTAIKSGRSLYNGIWDNKPPLLYIIYALFNGYQTGARFLSLIFGLFSVIVFFFIAKKLFQSRKIVFITTSVFAFLFATPFLEGNIANAENFMLLPVLISALFVFKTSEHLSEKQNHFLYKEKTKLFYAGFLLGLTFLIKVVSVFDFAAFFVFIFLISYKDLKSVPGQFGKLFSFTLGFIVPIILTFLFFLTRGELKIFITSAFLSNVSYVAYGNKFFIPHGLLILKCFLLLIFIAILFLKRKILTKTDLFILLWTAFSLFNAFFSQRPYTHYILTFIAGFSLYIGLCFQKSKLRILSVLTGIMLILIVNNEFNLNTRINKNIFGYYANFLAFVTQQKTTSDYFKFFDPVTPRDYSLSSYINMHKKSGDRLFVWGDSAQIYKLTDMLPPGRFIVAYHMTMSSQNTQETGLALGKIQPKYIIILPNAPVIPYSLVRYQPKLSIQNAIIYEKVF